jgi:CubicO group peptidase (beta-lactamase class C family)
MPELDLRPFVAAMEGARLLGVVVLRHGERVAGHQWEPEERRLQWSASKSFTATAVGIALKEGLLGLDERVVDCFPAETPADASANLRAATVRDLLTMGMGQDRSWLMSDQRVTLAERDWVRHALAASLPHAPGERFCYDNRGPYLAGVIVQQRAGCDLVDYLMPRLFTPLGISRPTWETDPQGRTFGASGLILAVSELARLGQLYLQDGAWEGRQIVTPGFARAATGTQIGTAHHSDQPDWRCGYGYLFWMGRHGTFRADGKYGQFAVVSRAQDAVVAINAESRDTQPILDAVYTHILGV